jgi:hypothetical protein
LHFLTLKHELQHWLSCGTEGERGIFIWNWEKGSDRDVTRREEKDTTTTEFQPIFLTNLKVYMTSREFTGVFVWEQAGSFEPLKLCSKESQYALPSWTPKGKKQYALCPVGLQAVEGGSTYHGLDSPESDF